MPRPSSPPIESPGYLSWHYRFLLMRIQACLREHYPKEKGILVFDTQDPYSDLLISRNFSNFLFRSPEGQKYDLLDTPFFVDSRTAHGIQLADIAAGVIRNYFESGLAIKSTHSMFEQLIVTYYQVILANTKDFRSPDVPDFTGTTLYGIYMMSEKWFYVNPGNLVT